MRKMMRESINDALREEMLNDEKVFLIGEDIGAYGGTLQITAGLFDEFGPERVRDTPISEYAITGASVGAAIMGMRPVLELMYADFLPLAADQLVNNAAKVSYGTDGSMNVPMVIRAPFGAGTRSGMHHSQNLESWFLNVPGIKVVMPSNAYDAKGLLKSAIRDNNPVLFLEHKMLLGARDEVPEEEYLIPIGKAEVKKEGEDLTIVSWGKMVGESLRAAKTLEEEGISVEVIDLRTISPIDEDTIVNSVIKTSRLLVAHEAIKTGGVGGEIAAIVADKAFGYLDAPIMRVGAPFAPVPYSPSLEDAHMVGAEDIISTAKYMFGKES